MADNHRVPSDQAIDDTAPDGIEMMHSAMMNSVLRTIFTGDRRSWR